MLERDLVVTLLVKVAVAASMASILIRLGAFKRMLLKEERTLVQRVEFSLAFAASFGAGVAVRVVSRGYAAVDLGLEGSLLSGLLGGYVTGLLAGVLISIPAMIHREYMSMALF